MISAKQLAANRLNSLKSTGPRTPEGKAITRLNAVRDGLTGQLMVVPREEHSIFVSFSQQLTASLDPWGAQELHVAARIVRDTWRLHRIAANEENMYTLGLLDDTNPHDRRDIVLIESGPAQDPALAVAISNTRTFYNRTRDFERASLIEQRLKRGLDKDYALFRQLQHDRLHPETKSPLRARRFPSSSPDPLLPERGPMTFERSKQTASAPNGFVFANPREDRATLAASPQSARQPIHSAVAGPLPAIQDCYWPC